MAADFTVFAPLAERILETTNAWGGIAGNLAGMVMAPIMVAVTIMVMWHGVEILRGAGGSSPMLDVFAKSLRAFLVVGLGLAAGAYAQNVVGFAQDLRNGLTGMFVTGATSSYSALDTAINQALTTWDPTWNWAKEHMTVSVTSKSDFSGVLAVGCWFVMMAALTIFAAICALNLVVIDFSLALIFALGPIFVACFAFQSTARFFDAWLGGLLKYVFTAIVIAAVVGLGIRILQSYTTSMSANAAALDFIFASIGAIGATVVLCILAYRIPSIAGDIVGGIGISAFGPSMAAKPLQAMGSMAKSGAKGAMNIGAAAAGAAVNSGGARAIAQSSLGQKAISAAQGVAQSSVGQKALATAQGAMSLGSIAKGSMANAYSIGAGRGPATPAGSGTGMVTAGRPPGRTHTPGGA